MVINNPKGKRVEYESCTIFTHSTVPAPHALRETKRACVKDSRNRWEEKDDLKVRAKWENVMRKVFGNPQVVYVVKRIGFVCCSQLRCKDEYFSNVWPKMIHRSIINFDSKCEIIGIMKFSVLVEFLYLKNELFLYFECTDK